MMTLFAGVLLASMSAAAILIGVGRIARLDLHRLAQLDEVSRKFFKSARVLLDDEEVPAAWKGTVLFLVGCLEQRHSARHLYLYLARHQDLIKNVPKDLVVRPEIRTFMEHKPELSEEFSRACTYGMLSISFRSRFFGPILRATLAEMFSDPRRVAPAAVSIERDLNRSHDHCLQAA